MSDLEEKKPIEDAMLSPLDRTLKIITAKHFNGDASQMKVWAASANPHLNGRSPLAVSLEISTGYIHLQVAAARKPSGFNTHQDSLKAAVEKAFEGSKNASELAAAWLHQKVKSTDREGNPTEIPLISAAMSSPEEEKQAIFAAKALTFTVILQRQISLP